MDLVFVLGKGSKWNNTEIRYSIRSAEKFLSYENIFVVGECPKWLDVTHIPAIDPYPLNKERNIFHKILTACDDPRISDDFIFMNDDHFILQEQKELPNYAAGTLEGYLKNKRVTTYSISVNNTMFALKKNKLPTTFFDVHCPIVYNKQGIQELRKYNWGIRGGYVIKSLYGNTHKLQGVEMTDLKLKTPTDEEAIKQRIAGRNVFSIADTAINTNLLNVLNELYPYKSKYEQ